MQPLVPSCGQVAVTVKGKCLGSKRRVAHDQVGRFSAIIITGA
jgi:hypothetical protein